MKRERVRRAAAPAATHDDDDDASRTHLHRPRTKAAADGRRRRPQQAAPPADGVSSAGGGDEAAKLPQSTQNAKMARRERAGRAARGAARPPAAGRSVSRRPPRIFTLEEDRNTVWSNMLTSSNQYLRPDYLSPLPTTLDAKKSPLALLAQTCSAIGADTPNPKLISAAEKASVKSGHKYAETPRERSPPTAPPAHDNKPSFKPYESCLTARDKTRTPEDRGSSAHPRTPLSGKGSAAGTPAPASVPTPRCASNQSCSSRTSPPAHRKTPSDKSDGRPSPQRDSPAPTKSSDGGKTAFVTPTSSAENKDSTSSFKPSVPVTSSAFLGGLPPGSFPLPVDLMTSSLMAAQHHALKNGLNPYLAYARMKAPNGSAELGACRDPYCTGCSLSSHLLKASCPAGCAHCDHTKAPFPLTGHPAAAAYAHAQLAALAAASQLPFVCSWMGGETAYCGKRFASSDELLQHLRSHTTSGDSGGTVGASSAGLALLGAAHPLLQRSYPTPPLSPLTPRFHPYSKPAGAASPLMPPQLPFPLPPHPSLAAYFPSYPLFGPRALHP
ncbi:Zinc finger protein Elbow [Eumeta japonica]|uniref:Zinc finger protein Elbow n=1 Tax=Eumeta variegata TaxID=151549 RepID=A0A4C1VWY6_EUMVA|nr:Zinc finger protein Elbow [Eumeta japonica]